MDGVINNNLTGIIQDPFQDSLCSIVENPFERPHMEDISAISNHLGEEAFVLAVASSGLHCIDMLAHNTRMVLAIDAVDDQVALNLMYRAAIQQLEREEFRHVFVEAPDNVSRYKNFSNYWGRISEAVPEQAKRLIDRLMSDTMMMFTPIYRLRYPLKPEEKSELFGFSDSVESYQKVREKIASGAWQIIHGQMPAVLRKVPLQFDALYLSNIREWSFYSGYDGQEDRALAEASGAVVRPGGILYLCQINNHERNIGNQHSVFVPLLGVDHSPYWTAYFEPKVKEYRDDHTIYVMERKNDTDAN
jgi:hypothetical protein